MTKPKTTYEVTLSIEVDSSDEILHEVLYLLGTNKEKKYELVSVDRVPPSEPDEDEA